MKIAFISDIHANLQALESILQDMERQGVDSLMVLGDVASLGPNPKEVIDVLQTLQNTEAVFIRGNHDELLVSRHETTCRKDSHDVDVYDWAVKQLSENHIAFLKRFKDSALIQLDPVTRLIAYHASPWSNRISLKDRVSTPAGKKTFEEYGAEIFVGGHEHQQFSETIGNKQIFSIGSAGFPYKKVPFVGFPEACGWGEYAIITHRKGLTEVDFRKVEYDMPAFHTAASCSDNPIKEWCLSITRNHSNSKA